MSNLGFSMNSSNGDSGYLGYPQSSGPVYPGNPGSAPGYPPSSTSGYPSYPPQPSSTPGYPPQPSSAPGYPPSSTSGYPSYPPQPSSAPGYPPSSTSGYPSYPPQPSSAPGYPPQPSSVPGYPPQPSSAPGYPPQPSSVPGYPPQPSSAPGYPPQPSSAPGYPSYPLQQSTVAGYATAIPGYPSYSQTAAPGYPPQPTVTPGYPSTQSGYPATQSSYTAPMQSAYPSLGSQPTAAASVQSLDQPTIRYQSQYDASTDASLLRKAMKGFGTDEASIINVLANRTSDQRQRIILAYQQAYGKILLRDLQSELSGDFWKVVLAMMTPTPMLLADSLYSAMSGLGTTENTLVEILCTGTNMEIHEIKMAYQTKYRRPLQKDLEGDTSGHFRRLLISMATGNRDENNTNLQMAPQLAQQLYRAGAGRMGTDESEFNRILATYSYPLLRAVLHEYRNIKGKSLHDAIKSEFSGDIKNGLLAVIMSIENRPQFFAKCLNDAMRGMGTKDEALIRLLVSRSEVDLATIKQEYQRMYGRPLAKDIQGDTSGDYRRMLLALVK